MTCKSVLYCAASCKVTSCSHSLETRPIFSTQLKDLPSEEERPHGSVPGLPCIHLLHAVQINLLDAKLLLKGGLSAIRTSRSQDLVNVFLVKGRSAVAACHRAS